LIGLGENGKLGVIAYDKAEKLADRQWQGRMLSKARGEVRTIEVTKQTYYW
jgi:hypothetical protein